MYMADVFPVIGHLPIHAVRAVAYCFPRTSELIEVPELLEGWLDDAPEIPLLKTAQAELTRLY